MADMRAVRFDQYGDVGVLEVRTVPRPVAKAGQVLVKVEAAGINPGEAAIRKGLLHDRWPASFPSGQGSDLAGVVEAVGEGVAGIRAGDEVLGFTHERASHADYVAVPAEQLTAKPGGMAWEVAGSLFVAGTTAYAAVRSVDLKPGDTVAIANAAGGVGVLAVQLARRAGAIVLAIAGAANNDWLSAQGAIPVNHGDDLGSRLRGAAPSGRVDAFLDFFGGGYVALAVDELGVVPQRVDTIIDFKAAEEFKTQAAGSMDAANVRVLAELAALMDAGDLRAEIARIYPLEDVKDAFRDLEERHTRGKIVLRP